MYADEMKRAIFSRKSSWQRMIRVSRIFVVVSDRSSLEVSPSYPFDLLLLLTLRLIAPNVTNEYICIRISRSVNFLAEVSPTGKPNYNTVCWLLAADPSPS
jgi:hypothetical protein